jgi:predicted kinase
MSKLILIRGLPGSGKSTLARKYVKQGYAHNETDMYFVGDDGHYYFDPHQLKAAHEWCQNSTRNLLLAGKNVVVSNTFTRLWEMQPYLKMPAESVFVIKCVGNHGNIHGVPEKAIRAMRERWEDYKGEMIHD